MKYLIGLFLLAVCVNFAHSQEINLEPMEWTKEDIISTVSLYSKQYKVSEKTMLAIIKGESNFIPKPKDGDMNLTCKRNGKPIRARGLVQITECYFPEVTDEEAYNPIFAIEFLAKGLSIGKCRQWWSTCPFNKPLIET